MTEKVNNFSADMPATSVNVRKPLQPMGIAYVIGRLDRSLNRQMRVALASFGLTAGQYTALSVFRARGWLSNAQLAERIMVSPQAANELIKTMEQKGWIERQPDPTHKRIIQISITREAETLLDQCDMAIGVLETQMLDGLSEDERTVLKRQLRGMMHQLSEL